MTGRLKIIKFLNLQMTMIMTMTFGLVIFQKVNNDPEAIVESSQQHAKDTTSLKVYRQMKRLESIFNPDESRIVEDFEHGEGHPSRSS
jgi:hypothetical protein